MSSNLRARLARMRDSGEIAKGKLGEQVATLPQKVFLFDGNESFVETALGTCYFRQQVFPLTYMHGNGRLNEILNCRGIDLILPAKDDTLANVIPEDALFLDTETTGLSGGTGTLVVLIGLGWRQGDEFILRQYFLTNPSGERAMFRHFSETAEKYSTLVTFNGKTFDVPLIQTRQIITATPCKLEPSHHIDLLFCSRRLWKERIKSCSLRSLESSLLGLQRHGDIPGEEIPAIYFNYLRKGDVSRLRGIFEHNVIDILSMVRLLALVAQTGAGNNLQHPTDYYALGKLYADHGRIAEAMNCYQKAVFSSEEQVVYNAMLRLSLLYKKQGLWQEAAALWQELVKRKYTDIMPYLELAKYYEHRAKNYRAALAMTEYALTQIRVKFKPGSNLGENDLRYRQERLKRKTQTTYVQNYLTW